MKKFKILIVALLTLCVGSLAYATLPTLVLKNQFGEQSNNYILGGTGTVSGVVPAHTIVANTTGATGAFSGNTYATVSAVLLPTMLLTGWTPGAGVVAGTDTVIAGLQKHDGNISVLQNGTLTASGANAETITTATAISTTLLLTNLSNSGGSDLAATLAAPSSQDGQIKILKMTVRTSHNFTLAMTNIAMSGAYTPTGTTTLTFGAVGQTAIFIAVGAKWVYLGGSAVAS